MVILRSIALGFLIGASSALPHSGLVDKDVSVRDTSDWDGQFLGTTDSLLPALHWSTNTSDLTHLSPKTGHNLYYTRSGASSAVHRHFFANANATWTKPSVVLEHSKRIASINCTDDGLDVVFTDTHAYRHAQKAWPADGDFVVISHTAGCQADVDGQRAYFNVSSVEFDDNLTAHLAAQETDLTQTTHEMALDWGVWEPSSKQVANTTTTVDPATVVDSAACASPPSATISGFPAAGCNGNFDATIDAALGYLNFSDAADVTASLQDFAPGLSNFSADSFTIEGEDITADEDNSNYDYYDQKKRDVRTLEKRGWHLPGFIQKAANAVASGARQIGSSVKNTVNTVAQGAKNAVNFVKDVATNGFDPSIDTNAAINLAPATSSLTDSYWGQQYQIWSKEKTSKGGTVTGNLALYCVDCGVKGAAHISGHLTLSLSDGIKAGTLDINGNIAAALNLGLDAQVTYDSGVQKKNIISVGLPGFSIPKIVTVGPQVSLDAAIQVIIEAKGQVLVGANATLPAFEIHIDIKDSKKSYTKGFTPKVQHTFQAHAEIGATAKFGLPFGLGVGLDIQLLKNGKKMVSVITEPYIEAKMKYDSDDDKCKGISYSTNLGLDSKLNLFDLKEFEIFNLTTPDLLKDCFSFVGNTTSTSKMVSISHAVTNNTGYNNTASPATSSFAAVDDTPDDSVGKALSIGGADSELNKAFETAALANAEAQNGTNQDGFTYTTIMDQTGTYALSSDTDGNLRLASADTNAAGVTWASYNNIIGSDIGERVLFFYPDTMKAFGVSRLRIGSLKQLPKSSDVVSFAALNVDNSDSTSGIYMVFDTQGNAYYPMACNYNNDDKPARLFLASDATAGETTLEKNGDLSYIVTGGEVAKCSFIGLTANGTPGF